MTNAEFFSESRKKNGSFWHQFDHYQIECISASPPTESQDEAMPHYKDMSHTKPDQTQSSNTDDPQDNGDDDKDEGSDTFP